MTTIKEQIIKDLKKALADLGFPHPPAGGEPVVEHPSTETHGDYATNIALVLAKQLKTDPLELAQKITTNYQILTTKYCDHIEVAPPGFINFWLSQDYLASSMIQTIEPEAGKEAVMVEFAHPNTHKEFHLGHLRNIILGEAISRIFESQGIKVYRTNYQGDVGLHVAKCLWAISAKRKAQSAKVKTLKTLGEKIKFLSEAYVLGNKEYNDNPEARKEIESINIKIYQKDPEIKDLWEETRQWSLDYFAAIYQRLNTRFDRLYFESEMADPGKKIVLENLKKDVFVESEEAIIFPGQKYGLHNRVFLTKVGLPTYEAKDLALAQKEFGEFKLDQLYHVVGPEQKGYFEVLFKALEFVQPETKGKEHHLMYGWVRLKTGKMSSRMGEVVTAVWLLEEVKRRLKELFKMTEEVAEAVAVGVVKYSFLKVGLLQEIIFDIEESVSLEGNSGPYLQYTYARTQSVLKKRKAQSAKRKTTIKNVKPEINPEELAILRTLYKFPEVISDAAQNYSPNLICQFLFDLSQKFNLFYQKHPILKMEPGQREFRLALTEAVGQVLRNGLYLLGISAPEKM